MKILAFYQLCRRPSLVGVAALALALGHCWLPDAWAQKGSRGGGNGESRSGEGGRSGNRGGGDRPSASRQRGGDRPNNSRPSADASRGRGRGEVNRRSADRPKTVAPPRAADPSQRLRDGDRPQRPNLGSDRGERPRRPNVTGERSPRPDRPSVGADRPQRGDDRPSLSGPRRGDQPGRAGDRPRLPTDRPNIGDRPRPGTRPDIGDRRRPDEDRPTLGGDRSVRPGDRDRDRTQLGDDRRFRPGDRRDPAKIADFRPPQQPERPRIAGNRPNWGDRRLDWNDNQWRVHHLATAINTGLYGNRYQPGWNRHSWNNYGGRRGDWGLGNTWYDNWNYYGVRPRWRNTWYGGSWRGSNWGDYWYRPLAWTALGWGLGTWTSGWGYGTGYYNPYYGPGLVEQAPYNYAEPVVVSVVTQEADQPAAEDDQSAKAIALFEEGLAHFKAGEYRAALSKFDNALELLPGDPVLHEVRAVALFATGDYNASAAALNSLLSSAPGMDWDSMSNLYGNVDDYVAQVEKLQAHVKDKPDDAAASFVMAYHYLVLGEQDDAIAMLENVVEQQPKDVVAKRMLEALRSESTTEPQTAGQASPPADRVAVTANRPTGEQTETDLVGTWKATAGDAKIDLTIEEDFQFTWKAEQPNDKSVSLTGEIIVASDGIVLKSEEQGAMAGQVTSQGPDRWKLNLEGAPDDQAGLEFARVK